MLDTAIDALRRGDAAAALSAADAAVAAEPGDHRALHLQGLARRAVGDVAGAREAIERAVAIAPEQADYQLSLATLALAAGDTAQARSTLEGAVGTDPNQLGAYVMLAHLALARGDRDEAERQLRLAQRVEPEHPQTRVLEGQLQLARGDAAAALATLSGVARQRPDDLLVQAALATAYLANDHAAFAEQALRNVLAKKSDLHAQRRLLVDVLRRQKRPDEALAETETLLRALPGDVPALIVHGLLSAQLGREEQAIASLAAALRAGPPQDTALSTLMTLWRRRGELAQARDFLDERLAAGTPAQGWLQARVMLARTIDEDTAALTSRWHALYPDSLAAMEARALDLERTEPDAAAALAGAVLARAPGAIGARLLRYRVDLARDPEAAIGHIQDLAEQAQPRARAEFRRARGHAHAAAGRHGAALADWSGAHADLGSAAWAGGPVAPAEAAADKAPEAVADAPILVWGPPGTGTPQLIELLRRQRTTPLLGDRLLRGGSRRQDGFTAPQAWLDAPEHAGHAVGSFGGAWRQGMAAAGAGGAPGIDWLAFWDARLAARLRRELPGTRLLATVRDPRDALLHWIAFGTAGHFRPEAPVEAARQLAAACDQLAATVEQGLIPVHVVRYEAIAEDPAAVVPALADFSGLALEVDAAAAAAVRGSTEPPRAFAPGRWRDYADVLGEAFAELAPLASRMGYPA
ncbi:tetratricopeptide repeat protein [Coralloluteibacterium stylophorae]|uniref:Tetratricopeptide repeat protein n=1 Tax=Coralloluteibacterium stylophorae TaxID=1776034 RepID=A0A8J7VR42_9GAMM|nr:tetratricopeptide repeat protein [Coralloluteibacterium stylophorae]MBS7457384.1 tetratricopeptide repeat protein [Coralloluteibacterium stylophorae]